MLTEIAGWLPERCFHLCADGAYATLAGTGLPRTQITSRMRRDAALFEPAPPRTGATRTAPHQRRPAPHPHAAERHPAQTGLDHRRGRCPRHHPRPLDPHPRRALVHGEQDRPGPPSHRPRPRRPRTRRLLLHHRPRRDPRGGRLPLRRPLGDRGLLPRREARPRRAPTPSPGNAAAPNAQPPCPCGYTQPSGAGASRPIPPEQPGPRGPGTARRALRASSTPSPHSAACCGPNELQQCPAPQPRNQKSPTPYSTRSPTPHSPSCRDAAKIGGTRAAYFDETARSNGLVKVGRGGQARFSSCRDVGMAS